MKHLTILTGASRGMGLGLAEQLCTANALLLCISRKSAPQLEPVARERGASLVQWTADLDDPIPVAQRVSAWLAAQDPGQLASATLINNAGVIGRMGPLDLMDAHTLSMTLRVDLEAPMLLAGAFLRATSGWKAQRRILNISSGLGRRAMASQAAYCAAKAGMDHFSRCVALEEEGHANGAKICSLAPGVIDTDMQMYLRSADSSRFPDLGTFIGMKEKGVLASPQEAAAKVLAFLARPDFGAHPVADIRA